MDSSSIGLFALALLAQTAAVGCQLGATPIDGPSTRAVVTATPAATAIDDAADFRYPKGRWRLAPMALNETLQTVSHIVIRDAESGEGRSIYLARPQALLAKVSRSRSEAFALASELRAKAAKDPRSFAALAKQYSDDPWTADQGGDLGTVDAGLLSTCFLDALSAMPDESISEVIRCDLGYHLLYKRRTPPREFLSGYEIVLGYQGLETMQLTRGDWRGRDRDTALALARRLSADLRKDPGAFQELARAHSNVDSALRGGSIGSRSTYHSNALATENAFLQRLAIGEVSSPIESLRGFVIYLRAPHRPQPRIAMEEIMIGFNPEDPEAAARAGQLAAGLLAQIKQRPEAFAQYQAQYCCADSVVEWELGTGGVAIERALTAVAIGELVDHPVQGMGAFQIVRRVEATGRGEMPARLQLPAPDAVDVEALYAQAPPAKVGAATRQMRDGSLSVLALSESEAKVYQALLTTYASDLEAAPPQRRVELVRESQNALGKLLGRERLALYNDFVARWLYEDMMSTP